MANATTSVDFAAHLGMSRNKTGGVRIKNGCYTKRRLFCGLNNTRFVVIFVKSQLNCYPNVTKTLTAGIAN